MIVTFVKRYTPIVAHLSQVFVKFETTTITLCAQSHHVNSFVKAPHEDDGRPRVALPSTEHARSTRMFNDIII